MGYTKIISGRKSIATAGTAEKLSDSSIYCKKVDVIAPAANEGVLVIGDSGVDATELTRVGVELNPGDSYTFEIDNVSKLWADVLTDGDSLIFNAFT